MRTYPNLIGNRYGKLTVIEQVESKSGQRRWLCNAIVAENISLPVATSHVAKAPTVDTRSLSI